MKPYSGRIFTALACAALFGFSDSRALAQIAPGELPVSERVGADVRERVTQGRTLLEGGDQRALPTLRDAASRGLSALNSATSGNALEAAPGAFPDDTVTRALVTRAAEAHFYWGVAAETFAGRDEAIAAWTRALRLLGAVPTPLEPGLEQQIRSKLDLALDLGLPLIAPDDVLRGISLSRGGMWIPKTFEFNPTALQNEIGKPLAPREFLVTDGKVLPPRSARGGPWFKVPPLYRAVDVSQLPTSLQLDKMLAGYARETSGPNRNQWRQIVRVYYASPFLTKNKRDDLPRARRLVENFLKVHALYQQQLGATNLFARGDKDESVTTLWLLEVSALWPSDDEDPAILTQLGPLTPDVNTGAGKDAGREPTVTALVRPWAATAIAGQNEGAPGEIMFWKAGLARPESEWTRELFHEYGHVALPPFGGFSAPLEPYGNGVMGETLGMMWALALPGAFDSAPADYRAHVVNYALPARLAWLKGGPTNLPARGTREELRYLTGIATSLERVYGARLLGRALQPLAIRGARATGIAQRRSLLSTPDLLSSMETNWRDVWGGARVLPIYLPAALDAPIGPETLARRDAVILKKGARTTGWLWVPAGTASLQISGAGAANLRALGTPFKSDGTGVRLFFGSNGWQQFTLVAGADVTISGAKFERK